MRSERDAALTGERIATTQASELQHLVDQLQLQISELAEQRDLERRRADRTETARQQLDARLHDALETAKSEREDWTEYVRSVENRALSDLDRARQEAKELQAQQSKASEQHRALEKQLRQEIQAAQSAAATASQSADLLRGRCDALEGQLSGLRDLPAQLEVALKRSREVRVAADSRFRRIRGTLMEVPPNVWRLFVANGATFRSRLGNFSPSIKPSQSRSITPDTAFRILGTYPMCCARFHFATVSSSAQRLRKSVAFRPCAPVLRLHRPRTQRLGIPT